ncbi:type IV pilus biogenesis/stability protein PilW [Vespertiliibacter pulmonis]|uniref:Type IV pilus assembly protein PilF n=1 Tax=Vespertiliibacter pulmonis TaxID=1443036 RepID=A0A3N4VM06_9PAST|nr:type IV pilus biogenesis/stability protein PilW [Vespertiliibacter pulmonis]QLB20503.1 type IV pilus biogenesis/stability protein PilW [Vespertiliibacter pulmonis]RPE80809.1 type IV pilus assembly protein PilF [Vespertiliibacter pulmonis]
MKIAIFLRYLTACIVLCYLSGCVNSISSEQREFNHSQAVKARVNLALAYLEQNDYPKAKENIDRAIKHDSNDYLPYSVQAYYYQQIGEPQNAEASYQQALELSKTQSLDKHPRPDVRNNYGTFLCKQGKFDAADIQFEQALKSQSHYYHQADTLENRILCALQAKNNEKLVQFLNQLEKLDQTRARELKKLLP